uniref:Uncharacterized protein n=1 Tax=Octopus bimaculoides TaxID=37653 RepID=A0A0L8G6Z5_OCTBM
MNSRENCSPWLIAEFAQMQDAKYPLMSKKKNNEGRNVLQQRLGCGFSTSHRVSRVKVNRKNTVWPVPKTTAIIGKMIPVRARNMVNITIPDCSSKTQETINVKLDNIKIKYWLSRNILKY